MRNCALNNVSSSLNPSSAIQDRLIGRDNVDGISDFLYCFPEKHILIFTAILLELFFWHFAILQERSSIKNVLMNRQKIFFLYGSSWTTWLRLDFENEGYWTSMQLLSNYVIIFLEEYHYNQTKLRLQKTLGVFSFYIGLSCDVTAWLSS